MQKPGSGGRLFAVANPPLLPRQCGMGLALMKLLVPGDAGSSRASGCLGGDATSTELALPHAILVRGQLRHEARELRKAVNPRVKEN